MKENKDKWIQKIRQRIEEAPPLYDPVSTWERMEQKIRDHERVMLRRRRAFLWTGGWVIAAAVTLLFFILRTEQEVTPKIITIVPSDSHVKVEDHIINKAEDHSTATTTDVALTAHIQPKGQPKQQQQQLPLPEQHIPEQHIPEEERQTQQQQTQEQQARQDTTKSSVRKKTPSDLLFPEDQKDTRRTTDNNNKVTLSASGLLSWQGSELAKAMNLSQAFFKENPAFSYVTTQKVHSEGFKDELGFAASAFTHYEYKHKLPVSFGIYAAFPIQNNVYLESGLFATRLVTSVYSVGQQTSSVFLTDQELWFLGVPARIRWNFINSRYIAAYVSTGGAAEKCISFVYTSVFDREGMSFSSRDIPIQWSVNAALGLQYSITRTVGIFLEPGVSFFFDNHSPVKTYWQDKPLNFRLNAGVRFGF